jgi:crotonobetainyl-CoA:carnitine CoA-transferase CaiB-like acyl-CoA transferase
MSEILSDIRVVDFSSGMAGAVATLLLAEAGADVLRIAVPTAHGTAAVLPAAFANRSKCCIAIDVKTPAGRSALGEHLAGADLLVHDFTPVQAQGLGLDPAALATSHPHLICVSITAFPAGHPDQNMPVEGSLVLAKSGICDEQQPGRRDGPAFIRFPLADWGASWLAATGAIARLCARDRGVKAGCVQTSLMQGALMPMAMHWYRAEFPSESLVTGNPKNTEASLFECADGVWLHLMTNADHVPMVADAVAALPLKDRAPRSGITAVRRIFPLYDAYKKIFLTRPSSQWLEALWAADIAVQAVQDLGSLYYDDQAIANDLILAIEDEQLGMTRQPAVPITMTPSFKASPRRLAINQMPWPRKSSTKPEGSTRYPLEGLKVLDLGSHLAGPLAPMLLADLGATVIKLESITGDPMRWLEWCFLSCQRGKRSIALQLKDSRAQPVLARLVRWADIVHHNMRMSAAAKLGLDYESLREINPRLIYTHVSAYGARGLRKDWPGFDQLFQASGGWEKMGAGKGNPPAWYRFGMLDHQAALASLYGTLLALRHRNKTGEGQFISASLLGATVFTNAETIGLPNGSCTRVSTLECDQMGLSARCRLFKCANGWMLLLAEQDIAWNALLSAARADDVAGLEQRLTAMDVDDAVAMACSVGARAVQARENQRNVFYETAANWDTGLAINLSHPTYGQLDLVGRYWDFGDMGVKIERPPPLLGEHSSEILQEMGYTVAEIEHLLREIVVR